MTEMPRFSPWCQMCLDGKDKERIDAHALHVLRMKQERARQVSKLPWRFELADTEKPLPRGSGQGPQSPAVTGGPQVADQATQHRQQADHQELQQ